MHRPALCTSSAKIPAMQEACHICTGSAEGVMKMEDNLDSSLKWALERADVPRFLQVSAALGIAPRACRAQGTWIPIWLFVVPSSGEPRSTALC